MAGRVKQTTTGWDTCHLQHTPPPQRAMGARSPGVQHYRQTAALPCPLHKHVHLTHQHTPCMCPLTHWFYTRGHSHWCVRGHTCMCVLVHTCPAIRYTCMCTGTKLRTLTHVGHSHPCTCADTHVCACTVVYPPTCVHFTDLCAHLCVHACTYVYPCTHTHTCTPVLTMSPCCSYDGPLSCSLASPSDPPGFPSLSTSTCWSRPRPRRSRRGGASGKAPAPAGNLLSQSCLSGSP